MRFANLAPGKYRVVETQAPDGYLLDTKAITFTIPDSAQGAPDPVELAPRQNTPFSAAVRLTKEDAADSHRHLAGATYRLEDAQSGLEIAEVTTGANGTATVRGLKPGHYQFVEVSPPKGYDIDTDPVPFEITYDQRGVATLEVVAKDPRLPGEPTPTPQPTPTPSPRTPYSGNGPPQTGDYGNEVWMILAGVAAAIFVIALGLRLRLRRKKK